MKNLIVTLGIILMLTSCSTKKEFYTAQQINTIEAYENFLDENPDSKFSPEAQKQLSHLKQERAWNDALIQNTIESINAYLSAYPNEPHKAEAEKILAKLEEEHDWQQTLNRNTTSGFESFISNYPQSEYKAIAEENLYNLKLEEAWDKVKSTESIKDLEIFRNDFPGSSYEQEAISLMEYLSAYHQDWEVIDQAPSIEEIQVFLDKYSGMSLAENAERLLTELDENEWEIATVRDDIANYERYLEVLPEGTHVAQAEKRIIDLEVKKVLGGSYGSMPPMDRISSHGYYDTNEIEVYNNTSYTLTILYSGPDSKRIDILPKKKMNFELPNGKYKVAAWVSNSSIGKFAGSENLEGGSYSVEYYISTRYY
jgi:outer membrane protein assembly factor BamD (BamD/ComL family)